MAEAAQPTRCSDAIFRGKAVLLQLQRSTQNLAHSIRRHPQRFDAGFTRTLASSATHLWTDTNPSEAWYQRGKIQNLRVAASRLHGSIVPAGEIFSFWQQVGRATTRKGYAPGRMLQEGCMIPAIGGGLCQLSNALYQVALEAGCEILERHPHSRIVPGSATAHGRDATVAWNYIDLRFRPLADLQLRVILTTTELRVSLYSSETELTPLSGNAREPVAAPGIFSEHACESCGNTSCYRHDSSPVRLQTRSATAYVLDNAWPEYRKYVAEQRGANDILAIPIDGERWKKPHYAWPTSGFAEVHTATLTTLVRAMQSRRLSSQGAARQRALLAGAKALAAQLAKSLTPEMDTVCISQSLLPFLWRSGALGGRRILVLMTQLPMRATEAALNRAYAVHPESLTLGDFRADPWLVDMEEEALANAERIVTPHPVVASMFHARAELLDWATAPHSIRVRKSEANRPPVILFPAKTLGRKGAFELREALRGLDVTLLCNPSAFEGDGFWDGFAHVPAFRKLWFSADMAVLPSIVESRPSSLLEILAAGIPVIATTESGLHPGSGATFVPALDSGALREAIARHLISIDSSHRSTGP